MKKIVNLFYLFLVFVTINQDIFAQAGTYYDVLDVTSSSFVTSLKARIRSPYTKISYDQYDETNVANFAAINNGNGTKSVFCVYSNFEYIYTGTFTWAVMSREHTWCHSWMPTYSSESGDEYSDQYHLFPTHQNNANGRRSNHPLGDVVTATYTFMEGKLGKNAANQTVYEPRAEQKGNSARALLYMCTKYDDIGGNNWTFAWLNGTRLPSVSEAPQDLALLIAWHKQDPPDKREIERNNYIQSIQKNRNPYVDHPEYVKYIDFNTLTKVDQSFAVEPTNHVTGLAADISSNVISLSWVNSTGANLPAGYLVIAYSKDDYFLPIDGEEYTEDADLSDGKAVAHVTYSATASIVFPYLTNGTKYYFTVIPYNGTGSSINYKINGTLPRVVGVQALPVELTSFNCNTVDNSVILDWTTSTEINNNGFEIERRLDLDVNYWENVGFVKGNGNSTEINRYSFTDMLTVPGKYCYRLKQLDFDGSFEYSQEVFVNVLKPINYKLNQNYPNPFNPTTKIAFQLPEDSKVAIRIYNVLGQLVYTLLEENMSAGSYEKEFNASSLQSGVYFYRLETDNFSDVKKMVLLY
ncbi:MAG: endonuclease [bacterium]